MKAYSYGMASLFLALIFGMALAGVDIDYNKTCADGINNDGDATFQPTQDIDDAECIYMPGEWGHGEYFINGDGAPDFQWYVDEWNKNPYADSHWVMLKGIYDEVGERLGNDPQGNPYVSWQNNACGSVWVEDSMINWENNFGIDRERTGADEYNADCGANI